VLAGVLAAIAAGIAFLAHERRVREPMLDLSLFGDARLGWGTVAITLASFALAGLTFDLTQFFQIVNGHTPLAAGLRILPLVIGFGLAGHVGQHFVRGLGTGRTVTGGLGALALLFVALAWIEPGTDYWLLGTALFLIGMAMGMVFVPATDAVMSAMPERDAGVGSALNDASRQVGAALGIGALRSLTNAAYREGIEGTVAGLGSGAATMVKESVAGAMHLANEIGGQGGQALRDAAGTAFTDGFAVALLAAAGALGTGAVLVWRRLVPADTPRRHIRHHLKRATPPEGSRDPSIPLPDRV
jgi:DHA2 family multidrug resistance protein-like MFS transporter